jgi:hypothetical protein
MLGDIRAGWFEHCELRKWKLWYWGRLRGYVCHFLEFMKVVGVVVREVEMIG